MTVRAANTAEVRMVVVDLETGAADTLGFGTHAAYVSGHLVFSGSDGTLLAQPFDPGARRTTGQSVAILDGVALSGPMGRGEFALSAQGGLAYQAGGGGGERGAGTIMAATVSTDGGFRVTSRRASNDSTWMI